MSSPEQDDEVSPTWIMGSPQPEDLAYDQEYDTLQDIKTMVAAWDVELQDHEYTRDIKEGVSALAVDVVMALSAIQEAFKPGTPVSKLPTKDEVLDLCRRFDKMKPLVQDLIKNDQAPASPGPQAGPMPGSPGPVPPSALANAFETPEGKKRNKRRIQDSAS